MKKLIVTSVGLVAVLSASAATLRIMPLGDSITEAVGWEAGSGYRAVLRQLLTEAGYEVDYVGDTTKNPGGFSNADISNPTTDDTQHSGHGGWIVGNKSYVDKDVRGHLPVWFRTVEDPHVILLHLGTNDLSAKNNDSTLITRYSALLDELSAYQPTAKIIATTLLPRTESMDNNSLKPYFNDKLEALVAEHVAKGQHVYFLDLYPLLNRGKPNETGGDFPDNLHPNEAGFRKMAKAWFEKIQEVQPVTAEIPETDLSVVDATLGDDHQSMTFYFNKPVGDGAADLSHYVSSSAAFTPATATISSNRRSVTVKGATPVPPAVPCTLTVSGVPSESGAKTQVADKEVTLTYMPYGAQYYVPEAGLYRKVYELNIPEKPNYEESAPNYAFNDAANVGPYTRVAYYLELQGSDGQLHYAWVSMDAFTDDPTKLGVPTRSTGVTFQRYVENAKVYSNVAGVTNGERAKVNLEFWPYNYTQPTSLGVEGASGSQYDVDDTMGTSGNYGSMQIHDSATKTPIICFNKWGGSDSNKSACLGIGASTGRADATDWTFAENAWTWSKRRVLQIYVMESLEPVPAPQIVSAQITGSGRQIFVTFDSPIADETDLASKFTLSDGTRIWTATRVTGDPRRVVLSTNTVKDPSTTTLSFNGIASDTPSRTPGNGSIALVGLRPASVEANVPAAFRDGYEFVYQIDLPLSGSEWSTMGRPVYTVQDDRALTFDRVAYYVETVSSSGETKWVWLSCDKYTAGAATSEIALPYKSAGATGRFPLKNLEYTSNIAALQNLTGTSGMAELNGGDYTAAISDASQGGSNSAYDWNDTLKTGEGHGCFQFFELHEDGEDTIQGVPLVCVNGWSSTESAVSVGLGPNVGGENFDWTFARNANDFTVRRICAFVRPCEAEKADLSAPAQVLERVEEAKDYQHLYTVKVFQGMKINNNDGANMVKSVSGYAAAHPVDNSQALEAKTDYLRVGYFVELVKTDGTTNWVWTAFDRFSTRDDFQEIDIPVAGTIVQRNVANLDVKSNVDGIVTGTGIQTGNIEFWPYNYAAPNEKNIPNASGSKFDFGDQCSVNSGAHGSWQVHNYGAQQTLWAVNKFNGHNDGVAVGIGNCTTSSDPDYTFDKSAQSYTSMNIYVLIKPDPESQQEIDPDLNRTVYNPLRAVAASDGQSVCLSFKDKLDIYAADPKYFTVDGVAPAQAAVSAIDGRDMILTLAQPLTGESAHQVETHFPRGKNGTFAFQLARAASATIASGVDEFNDYVLVNDLAIGTKVDYNANPIDYRTDLSRFLTNYPFDRVAVSLELVSNANEAKWVWVSMDAYTDDLAKLGMPSTSRRNIFAKYVNNLKVYASENAGVKTGTWDDGNIEITPSNYTADNTLGIPGADGGLFDFGDNISGDGSEAGHACFQIHNYREQETILSVSQIGKGATPGIGIGNFALKEVGNNQPSVDGTFDGNAGDYKVRDFKVYVRPVKIEGDCGFGPQFLVQPQGRMFTPAQVATAQTVELAVYSPSATRYQWRKNGMAIPGATGATLSVTVTQETKAAVYDVIAYKDGANYTLSDPARVGVLRGMMMLVR